MDFVKVDDQVLVTKRDGERTAATLVFVNALGTDLRQWDRLTRYLVDRFHIVRFDMRGQGLSTDTDGAWDLARLADDLATLSDQLDTGPAVLVGVELGALVAVELSRRRPELAQALVLVGGGCRLETPAFWRDREARASSGGLDAVADEILGEWLPPAFRTQRPDETRIWRNMLLRAPSSGFLAGCRVLADADVTEAVGAVQAPTLALTGAAASPARRRATTDMAAAIDHAASETITDAALLPHVAQAAPTAAALTAFLEAEGLA